MTFRVSGAAVVSYVVTDQHRLVLPELGEISTLLEGATPNDRWEILCTPAFATAASNGLEYECAVHVVYPIATACGPAAVSVVQRHWRGRGDETARQNGVVGLPVQLLASGERLAIEPEVSHAAPPTAVTFRVDARQPVLDVEVVDVTGTTVAIGGLSSLTRGGSRTIHAELAEGRAALSAAFTPGPPYRADVLTADGEFFSAPFAFDGEPRSSMRFVRGAGRAPLVLDLGREVAIDDVVTIALATTALRFASRTVHLLAFDTDTAAFGAVDARTLWLQDAGLGWLSAHVILRDGRVALLHRTQPTSAVGVEVEWLATVALEPVELGGQERGERGQFEFRLGIPGAADPHWVTLRSLQYGRETGPWPTWRLVAPIGYGHQLRHRRVGHADVVTDVRALR